MFSAASVRGARHEFSCTFNRHSVFWLCLVKDVPIVASSPTTRYRSPSRTYRTPRHISRIPPLCSTSTFVLQQRSDIIGSHGNQGNMLPSRYTTGFWTFMFSTASVRGARHGFSCTFNRHSLFWLCIVKDVPIVASSPTTCFQYFTPSRTYRTPRHISRVPPVCSPSAFVLQQRSDIIGSLGDQGNKLLSRNRNNESVELKTQNDVVRFSLYKPGDIIGSIKNSQNTKKVKKSRKAKLNELRFYRLKAKQKMYSPNPEVRIRYKLEKAKRKETWLIEKLRKFDVPKLPPETFDPEILTEEERHYLKRTGEKKKHYVPVGRRGVFGGVVLNMHLHWKNHETVKVICKPCKPGQAQQYAEELARLSKGIVIDIKPNNIIIFYRGKNYVQPKVMSPPDTLSKAKALEKYRYEQSLEHTSQFIEKLEKELEEYHEHVAKFKKGKEVAT